jgi:hypothetical protein
MDAIAVAWRVLQVAGTGTAMGSVLAAMTVPELLFLLVGGLIVDRFPRLPLLLAVDLTRAD